MKKPAILFLGIGSLVIVIGFLSEIQISIPSRKLTFDECEKAGGVAWQVDLNHPDICPACAEYRACEMEYNDFRGICPQCYAPCETCQAQYSLSDNCPECLGACQDCQNKYLNDFENEAERDLFCPECKVCDICREDIETKKANCPACVSCAECKEDNKRYSDICEVCPEVILCTECMNNQFPYPDKCPSGKEKIGEISDAAIWFQCCR